MRLTPEQQNRYNQLVLQTGKPAEQLGHEYESAFYIMCLHKELFLKVGSYVDDTGIDFEGCLAEQEFSAGYRVLVRLAHNLFDGGSEADISPVDLMILDKENFTGALEAIRIRGSKIW